MSRSLRDPAGRGDQRVPGLRRHRHQILAVEQRAAVGFVPQPVDVAAAIRERLGRERQEVGPIVGRPILVERLQMTAFHEERQPEAVDRRDVRAAGPHAAASSSLALCCSSAGITETSSWMSGWSRAHSLKTVLNATRDRGQRRQMRVVLLRPDGRACPRRDRRCAPASPGVAPAQVKRPRQALSGRGVRSAPASRSDQIDGVGQRGHRSVGAVDLETHVSTNTERFGVNVPFGIERKRRAALTVRDDHQSAARRIGCGHIDGELLTHPRGRASHRRGRCCYRRAR